MFIVQRLNSTCYSRCKKNPQTALRVLANCFFVCLAVTFFSFHISFTCHISPLAATGCVSASRVQRKMHVDGLMVAVAEKDVHEYVDGDVEMPR